MFPLATPPPPPPAPPPPPPPATGPTDPGTCNDCHVGLALLLSGVTSLVASSIPVLFTQSVAQVRWAGDTYLLTLQIYLIGFLASASGRCCLSQTPSKPAVTSVAARRAIRHGRRLSTERRPQLSRRPRVGSATARTSCRAGRLFLRTLTPAPRTALRRRFKSRSTIRKRSRSSHRTNVPNYWRIASTRGVGTGFGRFLSFTTPAISWCSPFRRSV